DAIRFLLIVECKNWKRPVDRPVVQKIAQTRDAIGADKAAIASPLGFTREAHDVACSLEVALWIITLAEWVVVHPQGTTSLDWRAAQADSSRNWEEEPPRTILEDSFAYSDWNWRGENEIGNLERLPRIVNWTRFYRGYVVRDGRDDLAWSMASKLLKDSF